jgi:hypothetical protein
MCLQLANAPSCCAPTEREPISVTLGYKHLAPLGRNPTASTRCTSNSNSSVYQLTVCSTELDDLGLLYRRAHSLPRFDSNL